MCCYIVLLAVQICFSSQYKILLQVLPSFGVSFDTFLQEFCHSIVAVWWDFWCPVLKNLVRSTKLS